MKKNKIEITELINWLKKFAPNGNLQTDSRLVKPGDVFFAFPIPSSKGDGRLYIQAAIDNGAAAIVYEADQYEWNMSEQIPHKSVKNLIQELGWIAKSWCQNSDEIFAVAVTGTNGKTSCTQWIADALSKLDKACAVIGTIGIGTYRNGVIEKIIETGFTTPDAVQLQLNLNQLQKENVTSVAIEASSIGLHQGRMNGMPIQVAIFTNLTLDHLDYHGTMENYASAKEILFNWPTLKTAIVNADDSHGKKLIEKLNSQRSDQSHLKIIAYGIENDYELNVRKVIASQLRTTTQGTSFMVNSDFGSGLIKTQLIGRFNVSNALSVLSLLLSQGVDWQKAVSIIEALKSVPGRMQKIGSPGQALVVVDYAHTPDALEKTIQALQDLVEERQGRLWCVFGCGGDRDPSKRSPMGKIAQTAHHPIVTSDNPRTENPQEIIQQILSGMNKDALAIEDRAAAILYAIKHANLNDVVLIAGKGHENYQDVNGRKTHFSDEEHALLALATVATNNAMRRI